MYSRTMWLRNESLNEEFKEKIDRIITDANNDRGNNDPIEIRNLINNLETGEFCDVCGTPLIFLNGCPNRIKSNLYNENYNEFQMMHYDYWMKNVVENTDYSFLVERNKSKEQRKAVTEMNLRRSRDLNGDRFCEKCNKETYHNYLLNGCVVCHANKEESRNRLSERNIENWKNEEYRKFMSKVITDRNNKMWKIPEYREKILAGLTGGHGIGRPKSFKDGMYFDSDLREYVDWEDYKLKFERNQISMTDLEKIGFKSIPTFRTQESNDWAGTRNAFEQYLLGNEYRWFVYIKFDQNMKPLVVGKSGSLNVNVSGSDVSFSENINDGPARRYLKESNITWCKTNIMIMDVQDELEAYQIEAYITEEFLLFNS